MQNTRFCLKLSVFLHTACPEKEELKITSNGRKSLAEKEKKKMKKNLGKTGKLGWRTEMQTNPSRLIKTACNEPQMIRS